MQEDCLEADIRYQGEAEDEVEESDGHGQLEEPQTAGSQAEHLDREELLTG